MYQISSRNKSVKFVKKQPKKKKTIVQHLLRNYNFIIIKLSEVEVSRGIIKEQSYGTSWDWELQQLQ